jgi:sigma-54 dependent transcriptional regulator, acetoin dehydrogenase operon transcriptional activator AcoR
MSLTKTPELHYRQVNESLAPGYTFDPSRTEDGSQPQICGCLIVVLDAARPLDLPSRHWLVGIDEVSIGRSNKGRMWSRTADSGSRQLRLRFPDTMVSAKHTTLVRDRGRWILADANSRNGTIVNGVVTQQTMLENGDWIAVGGTFMMFRELEMPSVPTRLDQRADHDELGNLPDGFRTMSPEYELVLMSLLKIARSKGSIVLLGETGTGKEVLARAIHQMSERTGPLVAVNCGGIPSNLVESELFGHKAGAFSGATGDRDGLLVASSRGTIFLDEIGELSAAAQTALLRALQEGEVRPIGSTTARKVDLRVIAATNSDLPKLVKEKKFRADLWARLNGFTVRLPSLRDRKDDLGLLVRSLVPRYALNPQDLSLTPQAAAALFRYDWPLNVRELEKALERASTLGGSRLEVPHLPPELTNPATAGRQDDQELRQRLVELLTEHGGNVANVGRAMGKARQQIQKWCKRLGINPEDYRQP